MRWHSTAALASKVKPHAPKLPHPTAKPSPLPQPSPYLQSRLQQVFPGAYIFGVAFPHHQRNSRLTHCTQQEQEQEDSSRNTPTLVWWHCKPHMWGKPLPLSLQAVSTKSLQGVAKQPGVDKQHAFRVQHGVLTDADVSTPHNQNFPVRHLVGAHDQKHHNDRRLLRKQPPTNAHQQNAAGQSCATAVHDHPQC